MKWSLRDGPGCVCQVVQIHSGHEGGFHQAAARSRSRRCSFKRSGSFANGALSTAFQIMFNDVGLLQERLALIRNARHACYIRSITIPGQKACNILVICELDMLGYHGMDGLTASRMVRFMQEKGWELSGPAQAIAAVSKGYLVIAGLTATQLHAREGHVNIVRRGSAPSPEWGNIVVPFATNVSISPDPNLTFSRKEEGFAFPEKYKPHYYLVPWTVLHP